VSFKIVPAVKDIPKETFENIFKGSYNRNDIYVKKTSSRKKKLKIIYKNRRFKFPKV